MARALFDQYGRSYATEAGIRLADRPAPLHQLLVLATLLSARISSDLAVAAARELFQGRIRTPRAMRTASWQDRVDTLGRGHYRRYDERTATMLGDAAELLTQRWQGDLRRLRGHANGNTGRIASLLTEFPCIGPAGARSRRCGRRYRRIWTSVSLTARGRWACRQASRTRRIQRGACPARRRTCPRLPRQASCGQCDQRRHKELNAPAAASGVDTSTRATVMAQRIADVAPRQPSSAMSVPPRRRPDGGGPTPAVTKQFSISSALRILMAGPARGNDRQRCATDTGRRDPRFPAARSCRKAPASGQNICASRRKTVRPAASMPGISPSNSRSRPGSPPAASSSLCRSPS